MAVQTRAWLSATQVLSGAVVVQGELEAVVTATGANTFFGRTISLLNAPEGKGHLQKVLHLHSRLLYPSRATILRLTMSAGFPLRGQTSYVYHESLHFPGDAAGGSGAKSLSKLQSHRAIWLRWPSIVLGNTGACPLGWSGSQGL